MTTRAIVFVEGPEKVAIREISKPKLRDGYVLVKVHAVGINPTDWKSIHYGMSDAGSRSGCDYAGVVEELGENLGKPFKKGDRIAGFIHGAYVLFCPSPRFSICPKETRGKRKRRMDVQFY
jgi:NADPH:quinone reductase-like Zn-dependent oxidoreductase